MDDVIRIRGARQHNLKNLTLELPRRALTVITGPSGSGKSSLALDTLFAEGQRRYVESLSTYAKQFLDRMEKPDVDAVEGISPAVAIEQQNPARSSRSTVGTATEVHDYLRLLWARVGRVHCPECDRLVVPDTVSGSVDRILGLAAGTRLMVCFPQRVSDKVQHAGVVEGLRSMGFQRVMADGVTLDLGNPEALDPEALGADLAHTDELLVVVDRLTVDPGLRDRLADSIATSFGEGEGECVVILPEGPTEELPSRIVFTEHRRCPEHPEIRFPELRPALFSFNNPYGSCPRCTGFGATLEYDVDLIVPNPQRSLEEGAVDPWEKPRYVKERDQLLSFARSRGADLRAPWQDLPEELRHAILHGAKGFKGMIPFLVSRESKRYKQYIRVFLRQYQSPTTCPECGGTKLRPEANWVRVGGATIAAMSEVPVEELLPWVEALEPEPGEETLPPELALTPQERGIAVTILKELRGRLGFLGEVGLGYLSLSRQARTLSGGEAQRIALANSLGSALVDTLYVLDEPTIGLHPKDTGALLGLLERLRDAGNTVIVVEHDPQAIRVADRVVELGPGSGEHGGSVVFEGTPEELERADTQTGRYLSGADPEEGADEGRGAGGIRLTAPPGGSGRRRRGEGRLVLKGARLHNLRDVEMEIPLQALTVVTGVSGSGKSTLVHDVLYRALEVELGKGETTARQHLGEMVGEYDALEGAHKVDEVILVDQTPIGRTPRSNPVTYIKAWDEIRRIFASQPEARRQSLEAGKFSFNVDGGRCDACKGAGHVEVEMVFMADVFIPCDVCRGRRFKPKVLDVLYRGKNVADVLELTVDEAIRFFLKEDRLGQILWQLQQVGLGYLRLGQPATTLSGGEAQRLKIARELAGTAGRKGRKLYILDEPTTGLSGEDVRKLLQVLGRLLDAGNTLVVIEHNLDVMLAADWIVDLGPGAGPRGGEVVASGPPEVVARVPESHTGRYLAEELARQAKQKAGV